MFDCDATRVYSTGHAEFTNVHHLYYPSYWRGFMKSICNVKNHKTVFMKYTILVRYDFLYFSQFPLSLSLCLVLFSYSFSLFPDLFCLPLSPSPFYLTSPLLLPPLIPFLLPFLPSPSSPLLYRARLSFMIVSEPHITSITRVTWSVKLKMPSTAES